MSYKPSATGLGLYILRSRTLGDCSMDGISSRADRVTLVGIVDRRNERNGDRDNVQPIPASEAGPFAPTDDAPAVVLVIRGFGERTVYSVEPLQPQGERRWFMAGGTYVSGDSRFANLAGNQYGAIAFHDRCEER